MDTSDEDLWFLPGPPQDMAPTDPPWPMAPPRSWTDPQLWHKAEAAAARQLAVTAELVGRLDERLHHMPDGTAQRLDLAETCALMALDGVRIGPERLALYRAGGLATGDDALDLARANWALRRLQGRADPTADPGAFFDQRGSRDFDDWQDRQRALTTHPLTQSGFACRALWSDCFEHKDVLEAAIAARKIAPHGVRLTHALRRELVSGQLTDWLAAIQRSTHNALIELARLQDWLNRVQALTLPRQTRALVPVLLGHPVVPVSLATTLTTASRASCQRGLAQLESLGAVHEVTGQSRYRFWAITL